MEADCLYSSNVRYYRRNTGVYHGHSPTALQSVHLEGLYPLIGPSAQKDTHEHLLSPPESRGLSAPAANWRVYLSKTTIKSNIGDTYLKHLAPH